MASPRASLSQFGRLLKQAGGPVYVVNARAELIYVNPACETWTGHPAQALLGQTCRYASDSQEEGPAATASSLCPPPAAFQGETIRGEVQCETSTGTLHCRAADFIPLCDEADEVIGVLTVLSVEDAGPAQQPPASIDDDSERLHQHLLRFRAQMRGRYSSDRLLGVSPEMRRVRAQAAVASADDCSVLVLGPRGSGRSHVARAIHYQRDPQTTGRLVPLEGELLGADLLELSLTAVVGSKDEIDPAAITTLLLEEADRLSSPAQAALQSFLSTLPPGIRVVATARRLLTDLASRCEFREDLACALSTLVIHIPPLAQRVEDIALLAQAFLEDALRQSGRMLDGFAPATLDQLLAYWWPDEVMELEAMVRAAAAQASGARIEPADLPERLHLAAGAAAHPRREAQPIDLEDFLATVERELIQRALVQARGNKTRAAELLGMTRPRLYRRLEQLGLADGPE